MLYILKDKIPVKIDDVKEWEKFMLNSVEKRIIKKTDLPGDIHVSTVFIGIGFVIISDIDMPDRLPPLFETMVFDNQESTICYRYYSWDEAEKGHYKVIEELFNVH